MDAIISAPMGAKWERRGAQDRALAVFNGRPSDKQSVASWRGLLRVRGDGLTESEVRVFVSAPIYAE